jgi:hypothetical protein
VPPKPLGMHWRTYRSLADRFEFAEQASYAGILALLNERYR